MACAWRQTWIGRRALSTLPPTIRQLVQQWNLAKQPLDTHGQQAPTLAANVRGWVRSVRVQKSIGFVTVSDGSQAAPLQVVCVPHLCASLTTGTCIQVSGVLQTSAGERQAVELQAHDLNVTPLLSFPTLLSSVIVACALRRLLVMHRRTIPFRKRITGAFMSCAIVLAQYNSLGICGCSFEYVRELPHLRPRTNFFGSVLRLRDGMTSSMREYFAQNQFIEVQTPILTTNDCEGGSDAFIATAPNSANFFGRPAFLTVSSQLHLEAIATALSRCYTIGTTFRAENSNTPRHLAEFTMVEAEAAFLTFDELMKVTEGLVRQVAKDMLNNHDDDLAVFVDRVDPTARQRLQDTAIKSFSRMSYTEVVDVLEKSGRPFKTPVKWGIDLSTEHERWLTDEFCKGPVFVTDYPAAIKPFYMRTNSDGKTVAAMDLLVPGVGELVGGSVREERLDELQTKMVAQGLNSAYDWYLDLRRFGTAPHAGFGLGFERILMFATGLSNIRDVVPFPRHPGSCKL
eukprot:m.566127 g.566127  ORF g.566127 m.566127 type:complete len:514 (+) comp57832_c0_seq11:1066-2607(+)